MIDIICQDILVGLKEIQDNSIDCIIADPPYNIGKDFGNNSDSQSLSDYVNWAKLWLSQFERVLSPSGTGYIYGFSEVLAHISVNLKLEHRWLIWHYTNKTSPVSTFWQRSHESIICFWKDKSQRTFNVDAVREPYTEGFINGAAGKIRTATKGRYSSGDKETIFKANPLGAYGRDVIKIPTLAGRTQERIFWCETCNDIFFGNKIEHKNHITVEHPTQKPQLLTKKLIDACSKPNMTVLIPFSGSGSECLYCSRNKIHFTAFDINPKYVEYANKLIKKYS
jgi:site-specific DNA-methyltransferase (adenine-specific)